MMAVEGCPYTIWPVGDQNAIPPGFATTVVSPVASSCTTTLDSDQLPVHVLYTTARPPGSRRP